MVELNAAHLDELACTEPFDLVIFWASLEHMVIAERLAALRHGWSRLAPGAPLVIIETPNRLWPFDSHTADLPYFHWLPDELAFHELQASPRSSIRRKHTDPATEMLDFQRLGRGMSFHEVERALGPVEVSSCLQIERRRANPIRRLAWACSSAGRTARALRSFAPDRDRAWFQPFLYLAVRRT